MPVSGECDFIWSPAAISLLADMKPTKAEYQAIRLAVCVIAEAPEQGLPFFFESSPIPLRQFPVGRFLLIYRWRGVVEIAGVRPRPPV